MKVAFITPEFVSEDIFFDGGLANYLFRVSISLKQLNHEPIIIVSSNKTETIQHYQIEVHRVRVFDEIYNSLSVTSKWIYQSLILNSYLEGLSTSLQIDVIQYTNFSATGLYRIPNIPCVTRISSINALQGKYYNHQPSISLDRHSQLEMFALKKSDAIFGPSKIEAEYLKENEKIEVTIIESPFISDIKEYNYSLYQRYLTGKKYLLYFGTLSVLKGVLNISEIIKDILNDYPDLFFVFIGKDVGYNSKKILSILKEKAGICSNRILYFEKMRHEKLYPIIEKSFAVILPSRIDNFPNSCIEAMAHGKIVVGTRNTGFEQLIEHAVSGYLCERDNKHELKRIITDVLLLEESQKRRIEENARLRIQQLKPEFTVNKLIEFYKDVIKNHYYKPSNDLIDLNLLLIKELTDLLRTRKSATYFMVGQIKKVSKKVMRRLHFC